MGYTGQDEFRIEELTGKKRSLVLSGPSLPLQGNVAWEGNQRVVTTWYAGNPKASQQVLGPTESPTEVEGIWRLVLLLRSPAAADGFTSSFNSLGLAVEIVDPPELVEMMDSIRRAGQELRVSWGGIIRTGRLQKFRVTPERLEDIRWTATFEWNGRDETRPSVHENVNSRDLGLLERIFQSFTDAVEAVNRVFDAVEGTNPSSTAFSARTLLNGARRIQSAVSRATALTDRAVRVAKLPVDVVRSFSSIAIDIKAQVRNVADGVGNTPTELLAARDDVEHVLTAYSAFHTSSYQAERLADEMDRQNRAKVARIEPAVLDVVVARVGQSLRELARRYYDDPDSWQAIADANGMEGSVVEEGGVLIIPRRRGGR